MKKTFIILMVVLLSAMLIVSCDDNNGSSAVHKITFDSNGGTAVQAQTIKEGEKATEPSEPTKGGFDLECWTKDGVEFDFDKETITGDITLVAKWKYKSYSIGDYGPAWGIIFYDVDADNTKDGGVGADGLKSSECGWRYLEGALANVAIGNETTFCFGYYRPDGTNERITTFVANETIGTGKSHTEALVKAFDNSSAYSEETGTDTTSNYAAYVASSYSFGGYDDWFLPNYIEIKAMMKVTGLNVTKSTPLWSSTEFDATNAYNAPVDGSGDIASTAKSGKYPVRPVRMF